MVYSYLTTPMSLPMQREHIDRKRLPFQNHLNYTKPDLLMVGIGVVVSLGEWKFNRKNVANEEHETKELNVSIRL